MEHDAKNMSRVWWKGAFTAAIKGIPQGLLLGLVAGSVLYLGLAALGALGAVTVANTLAAAFGSFIYGGVAAGTSATIASAFNPAAIILFNAVLTSVGNFITGGNIAVNAYKQQIDHDANVARLTRLEAHEPQMEQQLPRSPAIQKIVATGPRSQAGFEHAELARLEASVTPTIH